MQNYLRLAAILLATVGAAVMLTVRLPWQWSTPRLTHVGDLGHFFLFGGLMLGFWWALGRRMWAALAVTVALNVACELAQFFSGRNPDVADVLRGLAGSLVAMICLHVLRGPWSLKRLGAYFLLAVALSAWPILEAVPYLADIYDEYRRFPVLCDFQSRWQTTRWKCLGAELHRVKDPAADGGWAGRIDVYDKDGAAILYPVMCDWSGYRRVCCELSIDGDPVPVTILLGTLSGNRIVTRQFHRRCGPAVERVAVDLPLPNEATGTPPVDVSRVFCLVLAVDRIEKPRTLLVRRIYLEGGSGGERNPAPGRP